MNKKTVRFLSMPHGALVPETVILANGEYPAGGSIAESLLMNSRRVVCCDGAADHFISHGGVPAAIVGDLDSLSEDVRISYRERIFQTTEQYSNDLTKAVRHCLANGWDDIVIVGATGKREDHTLGNISLLTDYSLKAHACIVTNYGVFDAVHEAADLETFAGQQLSVFTLNPSVKVSIAGVVYPIPEEGLRAWWRGTLNEATSTKISVLTDGCVLIFREF